MTSADKKQAVIYGAMGAAAAALYRFAPSVLHGLAFGVFLVMIEPFMLLFHVLFGLSGGSVNNSEGVAFVRLLAFLSAAVFWFVMTPRLLCWWGVYNPFRRLDAARPFSFRAVVIAGNWLDQVFHFGRRKTGGWGA